MGPVPQHRTVSPRALLRRARPGAAALETSCPAALFLLAAVTAVLSVRGNGFPYVLIPTAAVLLVWALLPVRDALLGDAQAENDYVPLLRYATRYETDSADLKPSDIRTAFSEVEIERLFKKLAADTDAAIVRMDTPV